MRVKGVQRPVKDIAPELGVDGIFEGSVERSGNRVHMTVQLIHAPSDTHLWAESYDRNLSEAFSLPSERSRTIAREVNTAISPAKPQPRINPEAHDAHMRGRYFWFNGRTQRSQEYFQQAIQLQPDFAAAWSGLADSYKFEFNFAVATFNRPARKHCEKHRLSTMKSRSATNPVIHTDPSRAAAT
jgi:tetratricopeptide (TPR) repeat protein